MIRPARRMTACFTMRLLIAPGRAWLSAGASWRSDPLRRGVRTQCVRRQPYWPERRHRQERWHPVPSWTVPELAQPRAIVQVNGVDATGELILRTDPYLYEHIAGDVGHHVCRRVADNARLPDIEGDLEPSAMSLYGSRRSRRRTGNRSRRCGRRTSNAASMGGRRVGDGDQILLGCESSHGLAVVIELGRGSVAKRNDPQLVRPL